LKHRRTAAANYNENVYMLDTKQEKLNTRAPSNIRVYIHTRDKAHKAHKAHKNQRSHDRFDVIPPAAIIPTLLIRVAI
jgi:hypothetical protein